MKDGCAVAGSKLDVALSPIGMAVRAGTAVRDIRRGQETAASLHPDAGRRLIQYLAAPAAGPVLDWMGLQPVKHRRLGVGVGLTQAKAGI